MSWLSKITGRDAARNKREQQNQVDWAPYGGDPNAQAKKALSDEAGGGFREDPTGWQNAFQQTAGAAYNRALPQLRQGLQLSREDAIRRGISTGDLAPSNEADITTAWGKGLADTFGSMAQSGYENFQNRSFSAYEANRNRYLDLLTGQLDRDNSNLNASRNRNAALLGAGINFAGNAGSAALYRK